MDFDPETLKKYRYNHRLLVKAKSKKTGIEIYGCFR